MNDEIWSRQFYKALEAVGKLTEVEKLRLGNMLTTLIHVNNMPVSRNPLPDRNVEPLPLRQLGKI